MVAAISRKGSVQACSEFFSQLVGVKPNKQDDPALSAEEVCTIFVLVSDD